MADSSVVVTALLLSGPAGEDSRSALLGDEVHAPHLLDVEVASALRRAVLTSQISAGTAGSFLGDLRDLPITRHGHESLLGPATWPSPSCSTHLC